MKKFNTLILMVNLCYILSSYVYAGDSNQEIESSQSSYSPSVAVQPKTIEDLLNDVSFSDYDDVANYITPHKEEGVYAYLIGMDLYQVTKRENCLIGNIKLGQLVEFTSTISNKIGYYLTARAPGLMVDNTYVFSTDERGELSFSAISYPDNADDKFVSKPLSS